MQNEMTISAPSPRLQVPALGVGRWRTEDWTAVLLGLVVIATVLALFQ